MGLQLFSAPPQLNLEFRERERVCVCEWKGIKERYIELCKSVKADLNGEVEEEDEMRSVTW